METRAQMLGGAPRECTRERMRPTDSSPLCVVVVFGGSSCTIAAPGFATGPAVRAALAAAMRLQLQQLQPYGFVRLASQQRRWWRRRPRVEWLGLWDELVPLCEHRRGDAAVVLRLCRLLPQPRAGVARSPDAIAAHDFFEARERFLLGDFPLRSMSDVLGLAACLLQPKSTVPPVPPRAGRTERALETLSFGKPRSGGSRTVLWARSMPHRYELPAPHVRPGCTSRTGDTSARCTPRTCCGACCPISCRR